MDKGFLDEGGYDIIFANDRFKKKALRDFHIQTYRRNIGDHIIMRDVMGSTLLKWVAAFSGSEYHSSDIKTVLMILR